ncbi:MAG: curli assembly protein CsgF [Pseudomonadales bacterium]|nr:curli assembly protein CsgF [Pseudomonadales bacterium]
MKAIRLILLMTTISAQASSLVYAPINPQFVGGNSNNASWLQAQASAQDTTTDPSLTNPSPLQQFNSALQNAVTGAIIGAVTKGLTNTSGNLNPGTITVGNFTVTMTALPNSMLHIVTKDLTSGATSSFDVYNGS